jgi:lysophospholipase L1-like esterase
VQGRGVGVITVDAGANDLLDLLERCGGFAQLGCIQQQAPAVLRQAGKNVAQVVGSLHQASPGSTIIVLQPYNPFTVQTSAADPIVLQPYNPFTVQTSAADPIVLALNQALAAAVATAGAKLANAYVPFNIWPPQPKTLCTLSNICGPLTDIHPSYVGYAVIAQLFAQAYASSFQERIGLLPPLSRNTAR